MRLIETINKDIIRCQGQIAAIFDLSEIEQQTEASKITIEGFQLQLQKLYNEKEWAIKNIRVIDAKIENGDKSKVISLQDKANFSERALQTHHYTIQQLKSSGI